MKKKVVVIGLDGATFTLLQPWMAHGKLPDMASRITSDLQMTGFLR